MIHEDDKKPSHRFGEGGILEFNSIKYELDERVATITLNRPERLNALNWYDRGVVR